MASGFSAIKNNSRCRRYGFKTDADLEMIIFETTFLMLAFANALGYALIASRARALVQNSRAISVFNKVGGTLLIGAGVATAAVRRA